MVIPTYNRPDLLIEAIESVRAQTFRDFELIIINDGSTDDTLQRLAPYAKWARIITQPNGGIGVARNRGIDEARGKYVALLDHDDWWLPDKLRVQVEFLEGHPECSACVVAYAVSPDPARPFVRRREVADADGIVKHPLLHLAHGLTFMGTSSLMFVRARAAGLRYGELRDAVEDVQFHIGLVARGAIGFAGGDDDQVLAVWRVHSANFSGRDSYYYNGIKLLRRQESQGGFSGLSAEDARDMRTFLAHCARVSAIRQLSAGKRRRGWEIYAREIMPQLKECRLKFLAVFPVMAFLPVRLVQRFTRSA